MEARTGRGEEEAREDPVKAPDSTGTRRGREGSTSGLKGLRDEGLSGLVVISCSGYDPGEGLSCFQKTRFLCYVPV